MEEKIIEGKVDLKKARIACIVFIVGMLVLTILVVFLVNPPYFIGCYEDAVEYYEELALWENGDLWNKPSDYGYGKAGSPLGYFFSEIFYFGGPYLIAVLIVSILIVVIFVWALSKTQIIVTDKRVTGKTYFGRSVDLPMDSISAVGTSWLGGVAVATSAGKISFLAIQNAEKIREGLRTLLMARQEEKASVQIVSNATNSAEELKKYKELLDNGIITQEEFNAKKKQLLGL